MGKTVTFKFACTISDSVNEITGRPVTLTIGGLPYACAVNDDGRGITHLRSGKLVMNQWAIKRLRTGDLKRSSTRMIGQAYINSVIESRGLDEVKRIFADAPVLNPDYVR